MFVYILCACAIWSGCLAGIYEGEDGADPDFAALTKTNRFVDKTGLIKWFADLDHSVYITAPRQFAKSTNLNMLQRFFDIPVNAMGEPTNLEKSENHLIFTKTYFTNGSNLAVFSNATFFNTNFGRHPVLLLNFSHLDTSNFNSFLASVASMLRDACQLKTYLLTSRGIAPKTRSFMGQLLGNSTNPNSETEAVKFVERTVRALQKHFNQTCLLLIDELDAPLQDMLATDSLGPEQKAIIYCLQKIVHTLFQNVSQALCVGNLPMTGLLSLNDVNTKQISFHTDSEVASFFGSTAHEVEFLFEQFPTKPPHISLPIAEGLYGGYETCDADGKLTHLYCTSVALGYLAGKRMENWCGLHAPPLLSNLFQYMDFVSNFRDLIIGYHHDIHYRRAPKVVDYVILEAAIDKGKRENEILSIVPRLTTDFMMQIFLELGYFSVRNVSGDVYTLVVPNFEVSQGLTRFVYFWLKNYLLTEKSDAYAKAAAQLGKTPESQEEFVKSAAALFDEAPMPSRQSAYMTPIVMFLVTENVPNTRFRLRPIERKRSTFFVVRDDKNTGVRTAIVFKGRYSWSPTHALMMILRSEYLEKFLASVRRSCTGDCKEVDFVLVSLDFGETVLRAALLYNDTKIEMASNFSCKITKGVPRPKDSDKGYKKLLKKVWEWSRRIG